MLTKEADLVARSEHQLRAERSRTLSELALYRERVREMDDERVRAFNTTQAHGALRNPAFRISSTNEGLNPPVVVSAPIMAPASSSGAGIGHGLPGSTGGVYVRPEELHMGSEELEEIMSTLHSELLHIAPVLLPVLRRLGEEVHSERARFLDVQAKLLTMLSSRAESPLLRHSGSSVRASAGSIVTQANPLAFVGGMIDPGPGAWLPKPKKKKSTYRKDVSSTDEPKKFIF